MAFVVRLKRAYEKPDAGDGWRVLVDRLWPRGLSRGALAVDAWMKDVAPSEELRRWFGHAPERWREFEERYREELSREPADELVQELAQRAGRGTLTLVYGAKDELHNQAVVLREVVQARLGANKGDGSRRTSPAGSGSRKRKPGTATRRPAQGA